MLHLISLNQKNTIDSLFNSAISSLINPGYRRAGNFYHSNELAVDLYDDGDNFVIEADLPGVNPSQVQIELEKDYLKIEVANEHPKDGKSAKKQLLKERSGTSLKRVLKLPGSVESEEAESSYTNGVLEVVLPKSQKSNVKIIPIT